MGLERRHQRVIGHSQSHCQLVDHRCHRLVLVSVCIIIRKCYFSILNRLLPNQQDFNRHDRKLDPWNISDRDYQAQILDQSIAFPDACKILFFHRCFSRVLLKLAVASPTRCSYFYVNGTINRCVFWTINKLNTINTIVGWVRLVDRLWQREWNELDMNERDRSNAQWSCIWLVIVMTNLYHDLHVATDEALNLEKNNTVRNLTSGCVRK